MRLMARLDCFRIPSLVFFFDRKRTLELASEASKMHRWGRGIEPEL